MLDFVSYGANLPVTIYSTDTHHPIYCPEPSQPFPVQHQPFYRQSPSSSPDTSPASLVFDPFADDSDSTASSDSRTDPAPQYVHPLDLHRQRERMHRVVAWVDGINYRYNYPSKAPAPAKHTSYTPSSADTPFVYYSSSAPSVSTCSDDEPYVIYSTPLPGTVPSPPAPAPSPASLPPRKHHAPAKSVSVPALRASAGRAHRRYVSLSSIREEDESRV